MEEIHNRTCQSDHIPVWHDELAGIGGTDAVCSKVTETGLVHLRHRSGPVMTKALRAALELSPVGGDFWLNVWEATAPGATAVACSAAGMIPHGLRSLTRRRWCHRTRITSVPPAASLSKR
ncbi:MAG: hypothetical protein GY904_17575 [Planctomycetaceae bacterium]|nr:hypothetical protein [Planctomycetaceae bacterium]